MRITRPSLGAIRIIVIPPIGRGIGARNPSGIAARLGEYNRGVGSERTENRLEAGGG
jgi:hypothetical protein